MPEILERLLSGNLFQLDYRCKTRKERKQEKDLKRFLNLIYPGLKGLKLSGHTTSIPSVVEVLSFVDHLCFYSIPPHPELDEKNLIYLRYLLNRAVAELMMEYQEAAYQGNEEILLNHFTEPIASEKKSSDVTIITTNYDLSIDPKFENAIASNRVDYGISYRDTGNSNLLCQPVTPLFRYYKLHGSLNWLRCDLCGQYYINPHGTIAHLAFSEQIGDYNTCVCNDHLWLKPVLVAPSLVRDIRDPNLLQIWKAATEAIRTADRVIFIGYSLPPEDLAIKALLLRGINGRRGRDLEVEVVQLGIAAKANYVNMFGHGVQYHEDGLERFLRRDNVG